MPLVRSQSDMISYTIASMCAAQCLSNALTTNLQIIRELSTKAKPAMGKKGRTQGSEGSQTHLSVVGKLSQHHKFISLASISRYTGFIGMTSFCQKLDLQMAYPDNVDSILGGMPINASSEELT